MSARYFSDALNFVIVTLDMTQHAFSASVGLSQSMITKLLSGEEAHRSTYRKIFMFLTSDSKHRSLAKRLLDAYMRDVVRDFTQEDEFQAVNYSALSDRDSAIASLFRSRTTTTLLALSVLGAAADKHHSVLDALVSLANVSDELIGGHSTPAPGIVKVTAPKSARSRSSIPRKFRLNGGSFGEMIAKLNSWEED